MPASYITEDMQVSSGSMQVTPKETAQDGCGVKRPAKRTGEFLFPLAARRRALCASKLLLAAALLATLFACGKPETADQRQKEADSAAGKVGQAAYGAAKVTGKVAKAAGRQLEKAAHDAHEGWKEAAKKDQSK